MTIETWILMVFLKSGYGAAAFTQEFDSKRACEFAAQQVANGRWSVSWTTCVPKQL